LLKEGTLNMNEIDEIIGFYEKNNDGKVNIDEYLDLMLIQSTSNIQQNSK